MGCWLHAWEKAGPKPQKGSLYSRVDCLNASRAGIEATACCRVGEIPTVCLDEGKLPPKCEQDMYSPLGLLWCLRVGFLWVPSSSEYSVVLWLFSPSVPDHYPWMWRLWLSPTAVRHRVPQGKLLLGWARPVHTSTVGLSMPEISPHFMAQQCNWCPWGRKPAVIEMGICAETRCFSMCSVFLPMHFRDMSRVWWDYLIFPLSMNQWEWCLELHCLSSLCSSWKSTSPAVKEHLKQTGSQALRSLAGLWQHILKKEIEAE